MENTNPGPKKTTLKNSDGNLCLNLYNEQLSAFLRNALRKEVVRGLDSFILFGSWTSLSGMM